jgi:hypothetical protein
VADPKALAVLGAKWASKSSTVSKYLIQAGQNMQKLGQGEMGTIGTLAFGNNAVKKITPVVDDTAKVIDDTAKVIDDTVKVIDDTVKAVPVEKPLLGLPAPGQSSFRQPPDYTITSNGIIIKNAEEARDIQNVIDGVAKTSQGNAVKPIMPDQPRMPKPPMYEPYTPDSELPVIRLGNKDLKRFDDPNLPNIMFGGAFGGFQEDENGEVTFNTDYAFMGMAAALGIKSVSTKDLIAKLRTSIPNKTKDEMAEFIEVVKGRMVKTDKNGMLQFADQKARQAFNAGLDIVNGRPLLERKVSNSTPGAIANLFDKVLTAKD